MVQSAASLQKGIWIASYPKSGNTWVRLFIHNLLREISGNAADAQDINRANRHTVWETNAAPYEQLLGRNPVECSLEEIAQTRPQVQQLLAAARSGPFFIKTHLAVANINGYPTINFDMTLAAIYVIRNPLDVAISYAHYAGRKIDQIIEQMAAPAAKSYGSEKFVYEFIGSWSTHVASWMSVSHRAVYVIRYEDMLRAPFKVFGDLAHFLRLAPSPDQLQAAIDKSSFSELSRQESEKGFVERPPTSEKFFRVGKANQWRDGLTKEHVSKVITAHAPMMQRTGYPAPLRSTGLGGKGTTGTGPRAWSRRIADSDFLAPRRSIERASSCLDSLHDCATDPIATCRCWWMLRKVLSRMCIWTVIGIGSTAKLTSPQTIRARLSYFGPVSGTTRLGT
jgi:hypothetical protein